MHLGVSMWSYVHPWKSGAMDIGGFIREARRIGADGVELLDFFYRDVEVNRAQALATLAETGLVCSVFSVAQNFAKLGAAERAAELTKVRFGVDEAVNFGAKTVRVFSGDLTEGGPSLADARGWIIEGLTEAANYARDKGVRLALENHGKLAGSGSQVRGIIEDVRAKCGHDALGANPDTGNFLLVEQPSHEGVAEVAEYAYMVHFKDFAPAPAEHSGFAYQSLGGQKFVGTAVGEGAVDLPACIAALRSAGFDGWLNVEYEAEEDPHTGVARSVANARKLLGLS